MADEQVQALLERIHEDGVKKADAEREELLGKSRAEAKRLVREAKDEADRIVSEAKREADLLVEKGGESLRQAARDVLLSLREQLQQRVQALAKACAQEAMTPQAMSEMLTALAKTYMEKGGSVERLEALLNEGQLAEVEALVKGKLGQDFRDKCQFAPLPEIAGGFKLVFDGEDVLYDFTDDALAETIAAFLNPKLAEIVRGKSD